MEKILLLGLANIQDKVLLQKSLYSDTSAREKILDYIWTPPIKCFYHQHYLVVICGQIHTIISRCTFVYLSAFFKQCPLSDLNSEYIYGFLEPGPMF